MKNNNHLEPHELALLFPALDQHSAAELATDIKINGQRDPIALFEGKILDGVQRYGACLDAKVEPETMLFEVTEAFHKGMHPVDFVMSKNFHRRHIPAGQKAAIKIAAEELRAKKFSTYKENLDRGSKAYQERERQEEKRAVEFFSSGKQLRGAPKIMLKSQKQMAEEAGVAPSVISKAAMLAKRSPRKFAAVKQGKTTLNDAIKSLPPTKRQRKKAEARAERLRAGLTLLDTLGKLREKAKRNDGQIYVEVGGFGFRCFQLCRGK
jgi:hypothetical protein